MSILTGINAKQTKFIRNQTCLILLLPTCASFDFFVWFSRTSSITAGLIVRALLQQYFTFIVDNNHTDTDLH